nr:unnamed protein product [Digitaria exilis]
MGRISIAAGASTTTCGKCDGGGAGMCGECFRAYFFGKFKLAVTSNAMIALENGYTKIMMWSYASGIARHVLSATVKGQLYSLPADVQYVDTSLKMQQLLDRLCSGINSLVASFDSRLRVQIEDYLLEEDDVKN